MEAERGKERQEGKIGGTQLGKGRREGGEEGLWKVGEKEQWRINESQMHIARCCYKLLHVAGETDFLEDDAFAISQFHNHAQQLKGTNSGGPLDNQTWYTNGWPQKNASKVWFSYSHNCTLPSGAVFQLDRQNARQNIFLLATAHDCETSLFIIL